jgi:hypothetical protein
LAERTIAIRGKRGRREKEERKGKDKKNNMPTEGLD